MACRERCPSGHRPGPHHPPSCPKAVLHDLLRPTSSPPSPASATSVPGRRGASSTSIPDALTPAQDAILRALDIPSILPSQEQPRFRDSAEYGTSLPKHAKGMTMSDNPGKDGRQATLANWVTAIAGAVATVSAVIFGVVEVTSDDDTRPVAATVTTAITTSVTIRTVPISQARLKSVGEAVVRIRAPDEWTQRRSFVDELNPQPRKTPTAISRMPTHSYVAFDKNAANSGDSYYAGNGLAITLSPDTALLGLGASSASEEVLRFLDDLFGFGVECEPQYSTRQVFTAEYTGLLRDWRRCGSGEDRLTDGLIFSKDGSHFAYVQFRVGKYEWDEAVDELLSSLKVDVRALDAALGRSDTPIGARTTP